MQDLQGHQQFIPHPHEPVASHAGRLAREVGLLVSSRRFLKQRVWKNLPIRASMPQPTSDTVNL
jgi:hypothetical protein